MQRIPVRTFLSIVLFLLICCSQGYAKNIPVTSKISVFNFIHAVGESAILIPSGVKAGDIDGVVVERDGLYVPVNVSIKGKDILITPCNNFDPGADYDVKVFTKNGKRYSIALKAEEYIKFSDEIVELPSKPSKGFNYSYVLYVPHGIDKAKETRVLVNCLNNRPCTDRSMLENMAIEQARGWINVLAQRLNTPCLVPAFPRETFDGKNEDYTYSQMLNRGAVQKDKVDLQLAAMIRDAQKQLEYNGIHVAGKVFVCGYSTDAKFAQRFTVLHPDMVMATVAGGIAGCTTYPLSEYKGEALNYPVGIANIKDITGLDFNKEEYSKVPQFFLMGETDTNDATQWRDCFPKKDADQINRLFGANQIPDRWAATQQILVEVAPQIKCKTYPGIGHSINNDVYNDMESFFKDHWTR